jgi:predicted transcriptional regulator
MDRDLVVYATKAFALIVGVIVTLSVFVAAIDEWRARRHPNRTTKADRTWRNIA